MIASQLFSEQIFYRKQSLGAPDISFVVARKGGVCAHVGSCNTRELQRHCKLWSSVRKAV